MKGYQYHLFVSYSRCPLSMGWVRNLLVPLLELYVRSQLGGKGTIFNDERLKDGSNFDHQLYENLAKSALLVPILTAAYFESEWCRREFAAMREREEHFGFRKNGDTRTLIVPIYISGLQRFPESCRKFHHTRDFRKFFNPFLTEKSPQSADFAEAISEWTDNVVAAWDDAVAWDESFTGMRGTALLPELVPNSSPIQVPSMISPATIVS